jgi:DNA repair protein RecN (Recombination protein N)
LVDAVADAARDARQLAENLEDDPVRLADVSTRLVRLGELRRKYGDTLGDVIDYREATRAALARLEEHDARSATLNAARDAARTAQREAEAALRQAREQAAGPFATAVEGELRTLAMPLARFEVSVADPAGEAVAWLLAANPGQPLRPLQKVASGGELARTMLAARLALIAGRTGPGVEHPPTLIFDEVDAGVGGEAAAAVGQALTRVAAHHQVRVVTHLAQVAAGATAQIAVRKDVVGDATIATATPVEGAARVVELSRMLSGRPDSPSARRHAKELLAGARADGPSAGERRGAR